MRYIPENERTPYVQSWHFTIQREIAKDLVLDVGYVGTHSVGLIILGDENQALPNALGQNLSVAARRPYQNFNTIEISWNGGFGTYNALQTKLEKRFRSGFYMLNSFTWSKAIDNAPGHLENYDGDNSRGNFYDLPDDKGISSYNQPLNDTLSLLYDLPFGKSRHFKFSNSVLDTIAGGLGSQRHQHDDVRLAAERHVWTHHAGFGEFAHYAAPEPDRSAALPVHRQPHLLPESGGIQRSELYPTVGQRRAQYRSRSGVL